jgi:N-acetyl-beta-hexosaminidase
VNARARRTSWANLTPFSPQTIYDEIEAVFPSGYTMMGGDEVNLAAIQALPEIVAAAAKLGLGRVVALHDGSSTSYQMH